MKAVQVVTRTAEMLLVPASGVRAMLGSPAAAARHPASRELRSLLNDGFQVADVQRLRSPRSTTVTARRGGEEREIRSGDLAFAAYATRIAARWAASRRSELVVRD